METGKISALLGLLAGLLLAGCQKAATPQSHASRPNSPAAPAAEPSANSLDAKPEMNIAAQDLGEVTLTNHLETCVQLGAGRNCVLTPKVIDSHNVQITLAVESKTAKGKIHDLSITQVVARSGKPLEVAVGSFSFSMTPNVVTAE